MTIKIEWEEHFPYEKVRKEQETAINFAIDAFIKSDKRFIVLECGTGVGKSAIGLTLAKYLQDKIESRQGFERGSYFVTTQKILQLQYEKDFGGRYGSMRSIYSSSNYQCKYYPQSDCKTTSELMRSLDKNSNPGLFKCCGSLNCNYKKAKSDFLVSEESVTNFPYFLTEATFSGKITPRKLLIIDEAHNTEAVLSSFVEISVSQFFAEKVVKAKWPDKVTNANFVKWIDSTYIPKLTSQIFFFERQIEELGLSSKIKELQSVAKRYDMMKAHLDKLNKFVKSYDSENWVMEKVTTEKRGYTKVVYRAIDISSYAEEYLFRLGQKVVLMSATILNPDAFVRSLGIKADEYETISIASPFPKENRPIISASIGFMNKSNIDTTLPKLAEAIQAIMEQHPNEKGIIHSHTYKIANYLKYNIKDKKLKKRILTHTSENRDEVLKQHMNSKEPTVLISPSMTEGVDLKGDLSRFQILCKVPYPFLGDPIVKKRMHKFKGWYSLQTAKTIVQSVGRSIRDEKDTAVTYILDSDWDRFYSRNKEMFSDDFKRLLV